MRVEELLEKLQNCDPQAEIETMDLMGRNFSISDIEQKDSGNIIIFLER